MLRIIGRILLVILITVALSVGVYYLLNGSTSQLVAETGHGNPPVFGSEVGQHNDQEFSQNGKTGETNRGSEFLGASWLDLLKNLFVITLFIVVVALLRKVLNHRSQPDETFEMT